MKKICLKCKLVIKSDEDYVILETKRQKQTVEKVYYHLACWHNYFQEKVISQSQALVGMQFQKTMNMAKQMLGDAQ